VADGEEFGILLVLGREGLAGARFGLEVEHRGRVRKFFGVA
jgi:hypothetical protein